MSWWGTGSSDWVSGLVMVRGHRGWWGVVTAGSIRSESATRDAIARRCAEGADDLAARAAVVGRVHTPRIRAVDGRRPHHIGAAYRARRPAVGTRHRAWRSDWHEGGGRLHRRGLTSRAPRRAQRCRIADHVVVGYGTLRQ